MDAGQIIMMTQLPAGPTLPVATPVPSTAAGTPVEGQKSGGSFAGMLFGLSPSIAARPAVMAGTANAANDAAPDTVEEIIAVSQPEVTPELLAMLMASAGGGMTPAVATVADGKDFQSSKKEQDTQMLQNVAIWAAGAQLAQPQTDNGRMPVTSDDSGKKMQDSMVSGIVGGAAVTLENSHSRADMELMGQASPGIIAERGAYAGTAGEHALEADLREEVAVPTVPELHPPMQLAGVTPSVTLPQEAALPADGFAVKPEATQLLEQAGAGMEPESPTVKFAVKSGAGLAFNQADAGQKAESTTQPVVVKPALEPSIGPVAANDRVQLPVMQAEKGAETKPELQAVSVKSGGETSAPKAAGVETADAPPVASTITETAPKLEISASRGGAGTDVSPQYANAATGRMTEVIAAAVPATPGTGADQSPVADTGKPAPESQAASPRVSAVAAALADNRQGADHAPGNPSVVTENGLKAGLAIQDTKGKETFSDGSDSGSSGKRFAELMPKSTEKLTNVTQHVPGGPQSFSAELLSSAPSQQLQADAPRPDGHEQVARQVREQLASHDLKPGSDQITFKLSPDHLGDIKVNLRLDDQRLKVEIVADSRAARESLLQHVDSLKESLARQNISIEKFDVTTGGNGTGSQGNNANAQGEWRELAKNRQSQQWLTSGGYRTPQAEAVPSPQMYIARTEHAMVDLHF